MSLFISLLRVAFDVLNWLIIARVILSLFRYPYNPITRFVYEVTEPVLAPFRKILPQGAVPLDFSPLIAILLLQLIERLLVELLRAI